MSASPPTQALSRVVQARLGWRLLLALLGAAVCYLAFTPTPPPIATAWWDKLNHSGAFAALTVCACLAFPRPWRIVWQVMLGMLAFGAAIEVVQAFVPGRSSEWGDLLADSVGILVGVLLALVLRRAAQRAR